MPTADRVGLDAGGEAEKLAEELQKGCPAFFREDDRIFYRASGLLQQAESGTSSPAERADLAREALRLMMQAGALKFSGIWCKSRAASLKCIQTSKPVTAGTLWPTHQVW